MKNNISSFKVFEGLLKPRNIKGREEKYEDMYKKMLHGHKPGTVWFGKMLLQIFKDSTELLGIEFDDHVKLEPVGYVVLHAESSSGKSTGERAMHDYDIYIRDNDKGLYFVKIDAETKTEDYDPYDSQENTDGYYNREWYEEDNIKLSELANWISGTMQEEAMSFTRQ